MAVITKNEEPYLSRRFALKYFLNQKEDDMIPAELLLKRHVINKPYNDFFLNNSHPETKSFLEEVSTRIGEEEDEEDSSRTHS